jgi:hypothetical protein
MDDIIVFISDAKLKEVKNTPQPVSMTLSSVVIEVPPTRCKVTVNKTIVFEDVYVDTLKGEVALYKEFELFPWCVGSDASGYCYSNRLIGKDLVLQFKSDNYVIQAMPKVAALKGSLGPAGIYGSEGTTEYKPYWLNKCCEQCRLGGYRNRDKSSSRLFCDHCSASKSKNCFGPEIPCFCDDCVRL